MNYVVLGIAARSVLIVGRDEGKLFVGFEPFFPLKIEKTQNQEDAKDSEKRLDFVEAVSQLNKGFTKLKTDETQNCGSKKKGQKKHGVEFGRRDFEAPAEAGNERNRDNGNGASNENKKFVFDGFLKISPDFFD